MPEYVIQIRDAVLTDLFLILQLLLGALWCAVVGALMLGLTRLRKERGEAEPSVSVIVAARNEERLIGRCLEAVARQDYPTERWEAIIVNDGSTDRTAEIVNDFAQEHPSFRLLTAPPLPPGVAPKKNALLAGIATTTGEVILTTDADCVPGPGWVSGIARLFESGVAAVVGYAPVEDQLSIGKPDPTTDNQHQTTSNREPTTSLARFDSFINGVVAAGTVGLGLPTTAFGANFAYRRSAFEAVGGFGGSAAGASGDDDLLLQRIAAYGGIVRFASDPASFVPTRGPETLTKWLRMKRRHLSAGVRYGRGMVVLSALLYAFNAGLVALLVMAALGMVSAAWPVCLWLAKAAADGWTLRGAASLLRHEGWVDSWLIGELLAPFAIGFLLPFTLFGKVVWKERVLKR